MICGRCGYNGPIQAGADFILGDCPVCDGEEGVAMRTSLPTKVVDWEDSGFVVHELPMDMVREIEADVYPGYRIDILCEGTPQAHAWLIDTISEDIATVGGIKLLHADRNGETKKGTKL